MINLSKEESINQINLRKNTVVSLKKSNPVLDIKARVALVLDFSGSMKHYFKDGTVQSIIERIIPIALSFDDNGVLDFWLFHESFIRLDGITMDNFYGLANVISETYRMGGTAYAPVMQDVDKFYIGENKEKITNYVVFITDGSNSSKDKKNATKMVTRISNHPIFFQFVGIGNDKFEYLEKLDDMEGRYLDNVDFFQVNDINAMSDTELYTKLLNEFPKWLSDPRVQLMVNNYNLLDPVNL